MTWTPTPTSVGTASNIDSAWMGVNNNGRQAQGLSVAKEFIDCSSMYTSAHIVARPKNASGSAKDLSGGSTTGGNSKAHVTEHLGPCNFVRATRPAQQQEAQTTQANTRWVKGGGNFGI